MLRLRIIRCFCVAMVLLALIGLTGCAVPRSVGMRCLIANTAPVPTGGKRLSIVGRGCLIWYSRPSAYTLLNVPKRPTDMLSFYRQRLKAAGWVESDPYQPAPTTGARWYQFERSSKIGGLEYAHETLEMTLDASDVPERPPDMMKADFELDGNYAWG